MLGFSSSSHTRHVYEHIFGHALRRQFKTNQKRQPTQIWCKFKQGWRMDIWSLNCVLCACSITTGLADLFRNDLHSKKYGTQDCNLPPPPLFLNGLTIKNTTHLQFKATCSVDITNCTQTNSLSLLRVFLDFIIVALSTITRLVHFKLSFPSTLSTAHFLCFLFCTFPFFIVLIVKLRSHAISAVPLTAAWSKNRSSPITVPPHPLLSAVSRSIKGKACRLWPSRRNRRAAFTAD